MSVLIEEEVAIEEEQQVITGNSPEEEEAVRTCSDWFEKDKEAKKFYMDEMEEVDKLYRSDHWDLTGSDGNALRNDDQKQTRPNAVENMAFSLIEGLISEFSQDTDIVDFPVEEGDDEAAGIMTDLKKFIAYKNRITMERQKWLRNFFYYGTAIWETVWDDDWKGGKGPNRWKGDVRWRSLHPQYAFPDCRVKEDINDGNRFHKAFLTTIEYVRKAFEERGKLVQAETISGEDLIGDTNEDDDGSEAMEEQVWLVETWYTGEPLLLSEGEENKGEGLHILWWAGEGQRIYLKHSNYVYFDPEEDVKLPFHFRQDYPRSNSVWGYGEGYFLKNPQIMMNKTSEIIIEGHMHNALGQTWYKENALTEKQQKAVTKYGTLAGMWFAAKNPDEIHREYGKSVPASLQNEMNRLVKLMETLVGRFDISQGKTPGSVTAFRALDLLAQRAQVRLRSKDVAITTSYEDVGNYINNLIFKNYNEARRYRIMGQDGPDKPQYNVFNLDSIKKAYMFDTGESVPFTQFQPTEGMVEGDTYEIYCPEFDTVCKTSTTMPSDRLFYLEMAKELYAGKLIDEETFWYVMERGHFPPWEEMAQKLEEQKQQMMQMQQQQQMAQQQQQQAAGGGGLTPDEILAQAPPELQARFKNLSPEEQQQILNQIVANMQGGEGGAVS